MNRIFLVLAILTLPLSVLAQVASPASADWAAVEVYAGPSYMRISGEDLAGVQAGVTVNRWRHFSLVGTFGYHSGNQRTIRFDPAHHPPGRCDDEPPHVSDHDSDNDNACPIPKSESVFSTSGVGDVYTYMGGVRLRKSFGRLSAFIQAQSGIVRFFESNYGALSIGSGAQVGITQRLAVEAKAEYLPINCNGWLTKNVQATVGLVVRFGPWWGGFRKP